MALIVDCRCGQRFQAPAHLAGTSCSCPACGNPLDIPHERKSPPPNRSVVIICKCGQQFQAPEHLAGKQLPCPVCNRVLAIPGRTSAPVVAPQSPAPPGVRFEPTFPIAPFSPPPSPVARARPINWRPWIAGGVLLAIFGSMVLIGFFAIRAVKKSFFRDTAQRTEDNAEARRALRTTVLPDSTPTASSPVDTRIPLIPPHVDLDKLEAEQEARMAKHSEEDNRRQKLMRDRLVVDGILPSEPKKPAPLLGEQPLGLGYAITPPNGYYCTKSRPQSSTTPLEFEFTGNTSIRPRLTIKIDSNSRYAGLGGPPVTHASPPPNLHAPVVQFNGVFYLTSQGLTQRDISGIRFWVKEIEYPHSAGVTRGLFLLGLDGDALIQIRAFAVCDADDGELPWLKEAALSFRKGVTNSGRPVPTAGKLP